MRRMLKSKIHRCTVTQADLHYEGSVTIDRLLLEAADIAPFEEVHCWNVTRGTRFATYAIEGKPDSGVICINGAAAHLVNPGDLMILATFTTLEEKEVAGYQPKVVFVDDRNRVRELRAEIPGPDSC